MWTQVNKSQLATCGVHLSDMLDHKINSKHTQQL